MEFKEYVQHYDKIQSLNKEKDALKDKLVAVNDQIYAVEEKVIADIFFDNGICVGNSNSNQDSMTRVKYMGKIGVIIIDDDDFDYLRLDLVGRIYFYEVTKANEVRKTKNWACTWGLRNKASTIDDAHLHDEPVAYREFKTIDNMAKLLEKV